METGLLIEFIRMGTATVVLHLAGLGTVQIAARNAMQATSGGSLE